MRSAGILLYRERGGTLEVFLVHPGGPYWAKKDLGAWSIPKGEFGQGEDPLDAAKREFHEETGLRPPAGPFAPLGAIGQPSGKVVEAWSARGDCDPSALRSNTFSLEWPPRSGRKQDFPEVDRAAWFDLEEARTRILKGQRGFLTSLERSLATP
ncbi:MAG TPA: NUDIX domain-containing protein [Candidatus Eisenbacteria bacterium]|nr:NUDIX domain-containing protein [Candidatus Eisenbacteria bacterium]